MPSLSILLMCWNHRPYIEQCIRSLRDQTSKDFEVIFLDNVSTDGSFEVASKLLGQLGVPVTLIQNERPHRVSHNNNRLLEKASGELVSMASTDDWYAPTYVERMIEAAAGHPEAGMFTCLGHYFHHEEQRLEPIDGSGHRDGDVFAAFMQNEQPFFSVGYCIRRGVVEEAGGWDEDQLIEDQDFLARVTRRVLVHQVNERLVFYRRHAQSFSADHGAMIAGCEAFYAKHRGDPGFDMGWWLAERYRAVAASHIDRGELAQAVRLLAKAIRLKPLSPGPYRTAFYLGRAMWKRA